MKKILLLGWKDLKLAFRDRAAIILMLLAPFILTLGLGAVTGGLTGGNSGINHIPVVLVNQDDGQLGDSLLELFHSTDLADLVEPTDLVDPEAARKQVDDDLVAAAVIIPAGFTSSIIPDAAGKTGAVVAIELYSNPTRTTSAGVVQAIVDQFVNQVEVGRIGAQVTIQGLITSGLVSPQDAVQVGTQFGINQAQASNGSRISLKSLEAGSEPQDFNILAYMAPGMALMFLMFTVTYGGRSLLVERTQGTLPRLLVTPVNTGQVLIGKMFGVFMTGSAQMLILILASTLLFQLKWGNPGAVLLLVIAAVLGAVGWGMLITAMAKSPGQVSNIGMAIMLIFGILGGSFFDINQFPPWFRLVSRITPNAWGLDGFTRLAQGGGLMDILPAVGGLLAMAVILFGVSLMLFKRRGILGK